MARSGLGPQIPGSGYANGRVIGVAVAPTGRSGKSQRVPARRLFEYHLVKAGPQ